MQEQAINTFEEGLVMDLNPLTTPNNVLTNALNGTMITFNGNEFVLQNDMGNGRVETAYLPSGYIPIGIKEYGGIIYVASYNPITNKGQIGSFPSPERNISSEEIGQSFYISPETFKFSESTGVTEFYSKLKMFGDDVILRPGDKFAIRIYSEGQNLSELTRFLSDINNTTKVLRLRLTVLDSNRNLRDITKSLKRVKEDGSILTEEDKLLDSVPNSYWATVVTKKPDITNTVSPSDTKFSEYREAFNNLNVYGNKIAGEIYLIAELNIISTYDVSVTGINNTSEKPMNWQWGGSDNQSIVVPEGQGAIRVTNMWAYDANDYNEIKGFISSFNGQTFYLDGKGFNKDGQYVNSYVVGSIPANSLINYNILPSMTFGKLPSFVKSGYIDLSLVGTGLLNLVGWRYYNSIGLDDNIRIDWTLQSYPKDGEKVSKVSFLMYDVEQLILGSATITKEHTCSQRRDYNGTFTEVISYDDKLTSGKLYLVKIVIETEDISGNKTPSYYWKWLFTTGLYNKEFISGSELDFNNLNMPISFYPDTTYRLLQSKQTIGNVDTTPNYAFNESTSTTAYPFQIEYYEDKDEEYQIDVEYHITDESNYPFSLANNSIQKGEPSIRGEEIKYTDSAFETYGIFSEDTSGKRVKLITLGEIPDYVDANSVIPGLNRNQSYSLSPADTDVNSPTFKFGIKSSITNSGNLKLKVRTVANLIAAAKKGILEKEVWMLTPFIENTPQSVLSVFGWPFNEGEPLETLTKMQTVGFAVQVTQKAGKNNYRTYIHWTSWSGQTTGKDIFMKEISDRNISLSQFSEMWKALLDSGYVNGRPCIMLMRRPFTNSEGNGTESRDLQYNPSNRWTYYSAPWWRGTDGNYYLLNTWYHSSREDTNYMSGALYRVFNKIYLPQNTKTESISLYTPEGAMYSSNYTFDTRTRIIQEWQFTNKLKLGSALYTKDTLKTAARNLIGIDYASEISFSSVLWSEDSLSGVNSSELLPFLTNNDIPMFKGVAHKYLSSDIDIPNVLGIASKLTKEKDAKGNLLDKNSFYQLVNGEFEKVSDDASSTFGNFKMVEGSSGRRELVIKEQLNRVPPQEYPRLSTEHKKASNYLEFPRYSIYLDVTIPGV